MEVNYLIPMRNKGVATSFFGNRLLAISNHPTNNYKLFPLKPLGPLTKILLSYTTLLSSQAELSGLSAKDVFCRCCLPPKTESP